MEIHVPILIESVRIITLHAAWLVVPACVLRVTFGLGILVDRKMVCVNDVFNNL